MNKPKIDGCKMKFPLSLNGFKFTNWLNIRFNENKVPNDKVNQVILFVGIF